MSESNIKYNFSLQNLWRPLILVGAVLFLYAPVLVRLAQNWWTDENYSHGLLVPFLIAFIVYLEFDDLQKIVRRPHFGGGICLISAAILMLLGGTLGAELFTQRISLVVFLGGIIIYFFGVRLLKCLVVPLLLLVLAIPIPAIIFNKIAFPLQMMATQVAVWGVRLFDIPIVRQGNVIEILPKGAMQIVQMEVVEACSGIRSLMTLVTLALVYAYFTSVRGIQSISGVQDVNDETLETLQTLQTPQTPGTPATLRTLILILSAIPIAVLTNGFRVTATVLAAYNYGRETADGFLHTISGWLVYVVPLGLLFLVGTILNLFKSSKSASVQSPKSKVQSLEIPNPKSKIQNPAFTVIIVFLICGGVIVNFFEYRGEVPVARQKLSEFPVQIGDWKKFGADTKFGAEVESILRADDYVMRDYGLPNGQSINLYIGYYGSQKSGATYHSPLNCLPGAGWQMSAPALTEIKMADGKTFIANRYIVQNDKYRALMIYWYQGRGRSVANEYVDKALTIYDSILLRRSDGAMIRVMTTATDDEIEVRNLTENFAAQVSSQLSAFVPN